MQLNWDTTPVLHAVVKLAPLRGPLPNLWNLGLLTGRASDLQEPLVMRVRIFWGAGFEMTAKRVKI